VSLPTGKRPPGDAANAGVVATRLEAYSLAYVILRSPSLPRRDVLRLSIGAAAWAFTLPLIGKLLEWFIDLAGQFMKA